MVFAKSRVPNFLKVPDPKKISVRPDKLEQWVQIDWATVSSFLKMHFSAFNAFTVAVSVEAKLK
jgi:hypothetical protein